jgi:hypothetical protein
MGRFLAAGRARVSRGRRAALLSVVLVALAVVAQAMAVPASADSGWAGSSFCTRFSGSHHLTAQPYDGVAACGGSYTGTVSYNGVVFDTDGWQCVELASRWLYADTGLKPPMVDYGKNVAKTYHATYPQFTAYPASGGTATFSSSIRAGDIISMWGAPGTEPAGHVAVVTGVNVTGGNGTISLLEENGSATGYAQINVTSGQMSYGSPKSYYYYTSFQWITLAPPPGSSIAAAPNKDGRIELFGVNSAGNVYHRWQLTPGGAWSAWKQFDGALRP